VKDGGKLEIVLENHGQDEVVIHFADDGHGIPEGDLERIYEPFFSTKHGKGGTGLGLSITYGLVRELGGKLNVKSTVGEGTTFTVILPVQAANVYSNRSASA
jgi:signal transduction histidine kinase